jgi:Raf kinase inhibitor-like YbhB/YbcL family protein
VRLTSKTFEDNTFMPDECAFGLLNPDQQYRWGLNRNPEFSWSGLPAGTRSLAMINDDLDVPTKLDTFNREGMTVAKDLLRRTLCHWVLVDISPDDTIAYREYSEGVTVGGKPPGGRRGSREGVNEYGDWFRNDAKMKGNYFGYDGPCPPWNDERAHRYTFTVLALDVPRAAVEGSFTIAELRRALEGHVLGKASLVGTYTIAPDARPPVPTKS